MRVEICQEGKNFLSFKGVSFEGLERLTLLLERILENSASSSVLESMASELRDFENIYDIEGYDPLIESSAQRLGYEERFKILKMFPTIGVLGILGESAVGKTTLLSQLSEALNRIHNEDIVVVDEFWSIHSLEEKEEFEKKLAVVKNSGSKYIVAAPILREAIDRGLIIDKLVYCTISQQTKIERIKKRQRSHPHDEPIRKIDQVTLNVPEVAYFYQKYRYHFQALVADYILSLE